MKVGNNKDLNSSKNNWYSKNDANLNDENAEPNWTPYNIAISKAIEENYLKGIKNLEMEIGDEVHCFNLEENYQYLKSDQSKSCKILRASREDGIRIIRKNRFINTIETSSYNKNLLHSHYNQSNLQVKVKVSELFGDSENKQGFIFDKSNVLFNTEICISVKIHEKTKDEFYNKVNFNDLEEVISYLKMEINSEAENLTKTKANKQVEKMDSDYLKQAEEYTKIFDEKTSYTLEERLVFLYTTEGFLVNSINSVLREMTSFNSNLCLYFILLQAGIEILCKKYNSRHASQFIKNLDGVDYYVFYSGAKLYEKILQEEAKLTTEKKGSFMLYNEFLSISYDTKVSQGLLFHGELKDDLVRVLYTFLIRKEIADRIPNLFCLIEDISAHPQEKEVLLSSSTIFQVKKVEKHTAGRHYEVTSEFISNGYDKYDFLKYSSLKRINLNKNEIGSEAAKAIAESLKSNISLETLNLFDNQIGDEGAKAIAEALKTNASLQTIELSDNHIGDEGGKALGDALRTNASVQTIKLSWNKIGSKGGKAFGDALKTNGSLKAINLHHNQIGAEGGKAIGDGLKTNASLQTIDLGENEIGDEGFKAIAEALKTNNSLVVISCDGNKIGDLGAIAIGDGLKHNTFLQTIDLYNNLIADQGAKAIEDALKNNITLIDINICQNQVSDQCSKAIADALKNKACSEKIELPHVNTGE